MKLQQKFSRARGASMVGRTIRVLTDGGHEAHSQADALEIDGRVLLREEHPAGRFLDVTICGHDLYDLIE